MEKRKNQVRVSSVGGGGESPVDDGHSWRKYGQKEILGAKHPRGYYRCTHRHSQGCPVTKQVQRTDDDPTLFDVIYHGKHTCVQGAVPAAAAQAVTATQQPERNTDAQSLLQSLSAGLMVNTEGPAVPAEPQRWSGAATPFSFSSTPVSGSPLSAPENLSVSPATSDSNPIFYCAPLEACGDAEWQAQPEFQAAVDISDEFLDVDIISSFFA